MNDRETRLPEHWWDWRSIACKPNVLRKIIRDICQKEHARVHEPRIIISLIWISDLIALCVWMHHACLWSLSVKRGSFPGWDIFDCTHSPSFYHDSGNNPTGKPLLHFFVENNTLTEFCAVTFVTSVNIKNDNFVKRSITLVDKYALWPLFYHLKTISCIIICGYHWYSQRHWAYSFCIRSIFALKLIPPRKHIILMISYLQYKSSAIFESTICCCSFWVWGCCWW